MTTTLSPDARRIAILGVGGAGKSWLAERLGERTRLPVVHLDQHFWRPGWVEPPRDEWRARQIALLDVTHPDGWIADGNYGGTMDIRLSRADAVIFIDPPTAMALARVLRRSVVGRHPGAPPDPPRYDRGFLEFLRYVARYRRDKRPGVLDRLAAFEGEIHRLRSRREVERFLAAVPRVT